MEISIIIAIFFILLRNQSLAANEASHSLNSTECFDQKTIQFIWSSDSCSYTIALRRLKSFEDMNTFCLESIIRKMGASPGCLRGVHLMAGHFMRLNKSLDLRNINSANENPSNLRLVLQNMIGIDLFYVRTFILADKGLDFDLVFTKTALHFYWRGKPIDDDLCLEMVTEAANGNETYRSLSLFSGSYENISVLPPSLLNQQLCPIVFQNSTIERLIIVFFQSNFFIKSSLNFANVDILMAKANYNQDQTNKVNEYMLNSLRSHVDIIEIEAILHLPLNKSFLNKYVFQNTAHMVFTGSIEGIENGLFGDFLDIRDIQLRIFNIRKFYHASDNKWMDSLHGSKIYLASLLAVKFVDWEGIYSYPDDDYCLFKYFPHDSRVITTLERGDNLGALSKITPTCTILFLYKNYPQYLESDNLYAYADYFNLTKNLGTCNLTLMSSYCEIEPTNNKSYGEILEYNDFGYIIQWIDFIGPIVSFPLVSLLAFFFNFLIIVVLLKSENKKDFEDKMYRYILLNSALTCCESVLYASRVFYECIFEFSFYCPEFRNSEFMVQFRIYITGYLSETFKTCSIFTSIAFSLERFIRTSQTKNIVLVKFSQISVMYMFSAFLFISLLLSISKIFEFTTSNRNIYDTDYANPFKIRMTTPFSFVHIFYFAHYILNDFIFLVINLFIDFCLVIIIKKDLNKKQRIEAKIKPMSNKKTQEKSLGKIIERENFQAKKNKTENSANRLVISTLIVYSLCRLPEIVFYIFFYYYRVNVSTFNQSCVEATFCFLLYDITEYIYNFSYLANIFLFYKFNKNFRKNCRKLLFKEI